MKRIIFLSLVSLIAACSTTTPPTSAPAPALQASPLVTAPAQSPPAAAASPVVQAESPMQIFDRKHAAIANASIFFPYDNYSVTSDQSPALERHADLEVAYPNDHVTLQGNCDERGGREYNLALGQRRAEAVKERLAMLGVPKGRIETTSFGKEKPRATCHQEKCWADDRRVDFADAWR